MKSVICILVLTVSMKAAVGEPPSMSQNPRSGLLAEIRFTPGSTRLPDASGSQLGRIAGWAEQNFDSLIVLDGYGDLASSARAGLQVSLRRARLVRDQLVALGVDPGQIVVTGLGADRKRNSQVRIWGTRNSIDQVMAMRERQNAIVVGPYFDGVPLPSPTLSARR